jgi:CO/xanthine dehydrogenase Mo-binding subunit
LCFLQLFADKEVLFAGQPVGVIVAQTQELADQAAELVTITIASKKKPVLDAREIVKNKDISRIKLAATKPGIPKRNYHYTIRPVTKL